MKNTENNKLIGYGEIGYRRYEESRGKGLYSSFRVASGKGAGYSRNKREADDEKYSETVHNDGSEKPDVDREYCGKIIHCVIYYYEDYADSSEHIQKMIAVFSERSQSFLS